MINFFGILGRAVGINDLFTRQRNRVTKFSMILLILKVQVLQQSLTVFESLKMCIIRYVNEFS